MIILEQTALELKSIKDTLVSVGKALDLDGLNKRKAELEEVQNSPEFWNDMQKAQVVNKECKHIQNKLDKYNRLMARIEDSEVLIEMCTQK